MDIMIDQSLLSAQRLRALRLLAGISIALIAVEPFYSRYKWSQLPDYMIELLTLGGVDAIVRFPEIVFQFYPYVQIGALLCLMVPLRYSRAIFIANLLSYQVIFALSGISIGLAGQSVLFVCQTLAYGAILFLLMTRRMPL